MGRMSRNPEAPTIRRSDGGTCRYLPIQTLLMYTRIDKGIVVIVVFRTLKYSSSRLSRNGRDDMNCNSSERSFINIRKT